MVIQKYKRPTQTQYGYMVKLFFNITKKINMNGI